MQEFFSNLQKASEEISKTSKILAKTSSSLRKFLISNSLIQKNSLPNHLNLKIGAVDGSILKKSLSSFDLLIFRSLGVIYEFKDSKISSIIYYPSKFPSPQIQTIFEPLADNELSLFSNIIRQISEISLANELLEKFDLDFLMLDGSIIPHYSFIEQSSDFLIEKWNEMISSYGNFFKTIEKSKAEVFGIVKDSRGKRFLEFLDENFNFKFEQKFKDTFILSQVLDFLESTTSFPYSSDFSNHPILKHFDSNFSSKIYSFYLQNTKNDFPLRIDFYKKSSNSASQISSLIIFLTISQNYAIPSILLEADKRVRLQKSLIEKISSSLLSKSKKINLFVEKRRKRKPF